MVFKKYVTPNYDQVNELQIVMFCLNSILMFSFYLQLNRPISFWTSEFHQILKECFYNSEERFQMFVCADEWALAGLCWIHNSNFDSLECCSARGSGWKVINSKIDNELAT